MGHTTTGTHCYLKLTLSGYFIQPHLLEMILVTTICCTEGLFTLNEIFVLLEATALAALFHVAVQIRGGFMAQLSPHREREVVIILRSCCHLACC